MVVTMKLLLDIDVYAVSEVAAVLRRLANELQSLGWGDLEDIDMDLHDPSGTHRVGSAVIDN